MRRWFAVVALLAAAPVASAQTAATKVAAKFGWLGSWEAAQADARKTGKPIMVVFRCDP